MAKSNEIRIRYLIPLHDYVTMAIFEDADKAVVDCKLLRNTHSELMPTLHPELRDGIAELSMQFGEQLQEEIGQSDYQECPDGVPITIDLDYDLYQQTQSFCARHELTMEKLLLAFIRFCTKENQSVLHLWFMDMRLQEMNDTLAFAREHTVSQEVFSQKPDEFLLTVRTGTSPLLIRGDDGNHVLVFGWEHFWKLLGWAYQSDEKEKVEKQIARLSNN